MSVLRVHSVAWCALHGHPVLALSTETDRYFVVAILAEDAAALAPEPARPRDTQPAPRRLVSFIEELLPGVGARLIEVRLHVGSDDLLRGSCLVRGALGERRLALHFADAIALAVRERLPLEIADADLARVPLTPLAPLSSLNSSSSIPEIFRTLIESLDLDDLGSVTHATTAPDGER